MAAWREPRVARTSAIALVLYLAACAGLVGMILWKLWTDVSAGLGW